MVCEKSEPEEQFKKRPGLWSGMPGFKSWLCHCCHGTNARSVTEPLSASVFSALNGGNISSLLLRWLEGLNEMLYVKPKALRLRHAVRINKC